MNNIIIYKATENSAAFLLSNIKDFCKEKFLIFVLVIKVERRLGSIIKNLKNKNSVPCCVTTLYCLV
jgi:hypothetical protein